MNEGFTAWSSVREPSQVRNLLVLCYWFFFNTGNFVLVELTVATETTHSSRFIAGIYIARNGVPELRFSGKAIRHFQNRDGKCTFGNKKGNIKLMCFTGMSLMYIWLSILSDWRLLRGCVW